MINFTPGPWTWTPITQTVKRVYRDSQGRLCTQFVAEVLETALHESELPATGTLIAATPDLLAALLGLSGTSPHSVTRPELNGKCFQGCIVAGLKDHSPACEAARAALRKAGVE